MPNDSFDSFKQQLLADLQGSFPANTQISVGSYSHNNCLSLYGLTILEPGSNISPTIYLEEFFQQYQHGVSLPEICRQIVQHYSLRRFTNKIDTSFFTCLDKVRPQIAYKLIHYQRNRDILPDIPHFAYLDLAIVFYCLVPGFAQENASILIHNSHLNLWGISKDSLLLFAQQNTPRLLPWNCDSLANLLFPGRTKLPYSGQENPAPPADDAMPMYVLTNNQCLFGACCILYPDVLQEISQNLADDLYILPSSIHEIILIPSSFIENPHSLCEIVREVNLTEVAQDEILSDSIYFYSHNEDSVSRLTF